MDASGFALGAVLSQYDEKGDLHPQGFESRCCINALQSVKSSSFCFLNMGIFSSRLERLKALGHLWEF